MADVDTCLIVETLGPGAPTVVFDTDRPKNFTSVNRRQFHRGDRVSAAIAAAVAAVRTSGRTERRAVTLRDDSILALTSTPVLGPRDDVYAVQVTVSTGDAAAVRAIGGFEWDPESHSSRHGPAVETDIFGVPGIPRSMRVSAEIFRQVDEFPAMAAVADLVAELRSGAPRDSDTVDTSLTVSGVDGRQRTVHLSCRAVHRADGSWALRGLVHDTSDITPPMPVAGYSAAAVRSVVRLMSPGDPAGIGHLNFPTGVVTEWFVDPPGPLRPWLRENAHIHPEDRPRFDAELCALSSGDAEETSSVIRVRFSDTDWQTVLFEARPVSRGGSRHGLVKVVPVSADTHLADDPEPGAVSPPATMASIDHRSGSVAET